MNKLITLPTFVLYRMMRPFLPEDHMLKKKIGMQDWYNNSTELNRAFAVYFWITIPILTFLTFYLISR